MSEGTKQERSMRALRRYIDRLLRDSDAAYRDWLRRNDPLRGDRDE